MTEVRTVLVSEEIIIITITIVKIIVIIMAGTAPPLKAYCF